MIDGILTWEKYEPCSHAFCDMITEISTEAQFTDDELAYIMGAMSLVFDKWVEYTAKLGTAGYKEKLRLEHEERIQTDPTYKPALPEQQAVLNRLHLNPYCSRQQAAAAIRRWCT